MGLVQRNSAQAEEIAHNRTTIDGFKATVSKLEAELATLKMEDTKQLRKRLQSKSERVTELERELAKKPTTITAPVPPAVHGLSALLNAKLRRKLQQDGTKATVEDSEQKITVEVDTSPPKARPAPTSAPTSGEVIPGV